MSDNVESNEPTEQEINAAHNAIKDDRVDDEQTDRTVGDLTEEVARLRREAAKYRTERNELRGAAEKWQEFEESQKSELQKLQEANQAYEQKMRDLEQSNWRLGAATKYGVSDEYIDLLGSGSQDEIEARAEKLSKLFEAQGVKRPASQRPVEDLRPGAVTQTVSEPSDYPDEWKPKRLRSAN